MGEVIWGWIIGLCIVAAFIYWIVIPYWTWILGVAFIIGAIWGLVSYLRKRAAKIALTAHKEKQKEDEQLRRQQIIASADIFLPSFFQMLRQCIVIDSNIWMNENYEDFFSVLNWACRKQGYVLALFGPQFDEITNIKKNTAFGEDKNKRARLAINRIETFQKQNMLNIHPVTLDSKPGAYADPLIVKLLASQAKQGIDCTFISDDKELRIRVRQHLSDQATGKWEIVEMSDLIPNCKIAVEAQRYREIV